MRRRARRGAACLLPLRCLLPLLFLAQSTASGAPPPPDDFVLIPAGTFQMGSPPDEPGRETAESLRSVRLTRSYWMQRHEVTQAEWKMLGGENPAHFSSCGDRCPIENIDFYAMLAYANARSGAEGLGRCYQLSPAGCDQRWGSGVTSCQTAVFAGLDCDGYRLPTAAEWEYAYRAGSSSAFYNGEATRLDCVLDPELDQIAWYCGNSAVSYAGCADRTRQGGSQCAGTHPVGSKTPNAWGLYDLAGNVWENVWDWHARDPAGGVDPLGPDRGDRRVIRGGSWHNPPGDCRAARHNDADHGPSYRNYARGFRLVRTDWE
jgi:formylglycine-generating enzyme required for sulfatase activity